MSNNSELREFPKRVGPRSRGKRFVYHTHNKAIGCIYDKDSGLESVAMVNEFIFPGLTRRIVSRMNAGTI